MGPEPTDGTLASLYFQAPERDRTHTTQSGSLFCNIKGGQDTGGISLRSDACCLQVSKSLSFAQLSCCSFSLVSFASAIQGSSPGMWTLEAAAVIETRTDASRGPELLRTLHTYSPESAGDTWYSRSLEPWAWPVRGAGVRCQARALEGWEPGSSLPSGCSSIHAQLSGLPPGRSEPRLPDNISHFHFIPDDEWAGYPLACAM